MSVHKSLPDFFDAVIYSGEAEAGLRRATRLFQYVSCEMLTKLFQYLRNHLIVPTTTQPPSYEQAMDTN